MEYRISNLWPTVKRIEIDYKISYPCSVMSEVLVKQGTAIYKPDFLPKFQFDCVNDECTGRGFDLYSIVSQMVAHGETTRSGTMKCNGMEAKDHPYACQSTMVFTIRVDIVRVVSSES